MAEPTEPVRAQLAVGLPVRNGEAYLEHALSGLTASDVDGLVVVVNDNASTDRTSEIARDIAARDPRVRYRRHDHNLGANANFNDVFRACRSTYFKWAAVDDVCSPGLLTACQDRLRSDPGLVLAHGFPRLIDETGAVLAAEVEQGPRATADDPVDRFRDVLLEEVWCTPVFGVFRSEALLRSGLLRPFYGADKVLLAEVALLGRFARLEDVTFYRRCHDDQSTVLDARAKAAWSTGSQRASRRPDVLAAVRAYTAVALGADLPVRQRARALAAVARLAMGADKFRKLLLPGPYNYFGWTGRSGRQAYDQLQLTATGAFAPRAGGAGPEGGATTMASGDRGAAGPRTAPARAEATNDDPTTA